MRILHEYTENTGVGIPQECVENVGVELENGCLVIDCGDFHNNTVDKRFIEGLSIWLGREVPVVKLFSDRTIVLRGGFISIDECVGIMPLEGHR